MPYPIASIGSAAAVLLGYLVYRIGSAILQRQAVQPQEKYMRRTNLGLLTTVAVTIALVLLWARLFQNKGTFFGLVGAGLAVALKEPLLSIAGRLSIWAGHLYRVGDRIEFQSMAGDVIGIGIFYTRMLEIGNWIRGDQATGRIVQFPNSAVYQNSVFNYTQSFSWIWDELMIPITYASDIAAATDILIRTGEQYTREFLSTAEGELQKLRSDYLLPDLNLKPTVFTRVTSNYVELTMRYLVHPRQRRAANSWLHAHIFEQIRQNRGITIGSDTMDLTVHPPDKNPPAPSPERITDRQPQPRNESAA